MVTILSRRTKNNPILLGEPGVGKTAIVEGKDGIVVAAVRHRLVAGLDREAGRAYMKDRPEPVPQGGARVRLAGRWATLTYHADGSGDRPAATVPE